MAKIILVLHNIRSAHNVGSILRTADGLGAGPVYMTGYTPYPEAENDIRLPHEQQKVSRLIHKTALGAEDSVEWSHETDILKLIIRLKKAGYQIVSLELTTESMPLSDFDPALKIALIAGNEITGVDKDLQGKSDLHVHIPMLGKKESFNVSIAVAITIYHLTNM